VSDIFLIMGNKLTTQQAAEILGVSRQWVTKLITDKRLPAEYWGRDLVIDEDDLDKIEWKPLGRPKTGELSKEKLKKGGKAKKGGS
jgi:excisionase family DNA binding protein